jgi:hypothetical protein
MTSDGTRTFPPHSVQGTAAWAGAVAVVDMIFFSFGFFFASLRLSVFAFLF